MLRHGAAWLPGGSGIHAFLAWHLRSGFLTSDVSWRILEDERCGPARTQMRTLRSGGRSLGPSAGATTHSACSPVWDLVAQSWKKRGARRSTSRTLERTPRWGWDWNPALQVSVFLSCPPSRKCVPERIPPSTPLKGSKRGMGWGVHFSPPGRKGLLSGLQQRGRSGRRYLLPGSSHASDSLRPHGL